MEFLKEYQGNAAGRRLARDFYKMPEKMKKAFIFIHYFEKYSIGLAFLLYAAVADRFMSFLEGSWIVGGENLLNDGDIGSLYLAGVYIGIAALILWVIPFVMRMSFDHWYTSVRKDFKRG